MASSCSILDRLEKIENSQDHFLYSSLWTHHTYPVSPVVPRMDALSNWPCHTLVQEKKTAAEYLWKIVPMYEPIHCVCSSLQFHVFSVPGDTNKKLLGIPQCSYFGTFLKPHKPLFMTGRISGRGDTYLISYGVKYAYICVHVFKIYIYIIVFLVNR